MVPAGQGLYICTFAHHIEAQARGGGHSLVLLPRRLGLDSTPGRGWALPQFDVLCTFVWITETPDVNGERRGPAWCFGLNTPTWYDATQDGSKGRSKKGGMGWLE